MVDNYFVQFIDMYTFNFPESRYQWLVAVLPSGRL